MKLKYLNAFLLLLVFLLIPFVLRIITPSLEVYPSIVLPSGAGKVKLANDGLTYQTTEIYGKNQVTGKLERLEVQDFFKPIPVQYFHAIVEGEFGLDPEYRKSIRSLLFERRTVGSTKVTEEEREQTREWLRTRLKKAGCRDSVLVVQKRAITYNTDSKELEDNQLVYEKSYDLY